MAMQAGIGLTRAVILVGAGCSATVLFNNGKLSDLIGELQNIVKNYEKAGEQGGGDTDAMLAAQVKRLAMEVRSLASARPITVLNGGSNGGLTNLLVPTATVGALGYGYMWWKGLKFSDLMYVTKRSMATAVTNLTKHLEHVTDALAATKKHLTQRIQNVDGKLDEQIEISKLIRNEVKDVRDDISQIDFNLDQLHRTAARLEGKVLSMEEKQAFTYAGVEYLCAFVSGNKNIMSEKIQEQIRGGNSVGSLMGLRDVMDFFEQNDTPNRLITDGSGPDITEKPVVPPRCLMRGASAKC